MLERIAEYIYCTWRKQIGNDYLVCCVISVASDIERENADKFCSEALEVLLSAVNLRHGTHGFTSLPKEVILRIFTQLKKSIDPGSRGEYDNP